MTPDAAMAQAAALYGAGRDQEARALCDSILAAAPRHFFALHLASALALKRGDFEGCERPATRALGVQPNHAEVLCNRGAARRRVNDIAGALADYERALAAAPDSPAVLNNRGVALAALNRHDEAIRDYTRALERSPGFANARLHRALSRLVTGDLANGWEDFEARWNGSEIQTRPPAFDQPAWTGREDVRGKTILLHVEQGMGDAIQFCRYAPLLAARGARVVLEVHPPLKELLAQLQGVERVVALGETLPPFDYHCALLSVARAFGTTLATVPADIPYIAAPAAHVERWRAKLGERRAPRVGLAWSGSTTLLNDRNRSIPLARLAPLRASGATLASLQKEVRDSDRAALDSGATLLQFADELADFRDTAALISLLDLVITVDTAVAHLAGAMGKPVWILLPFSPDWRWLLDRDDSPWYSTATLFRQPRIGDWDAVVRKVAGQLTELDGAKGGPVRA